MNVTFECNNCKKLNSNRPIQNMVSEELSWQIVTCLKCGHESDIEGTKIFDEGF